MNDKKVAGTFTIYGSTNDGRFNYMMEPPCSKMLTFGGSPDGNTDHSCMVDAAKEAKKIGYEVILVTEGRDDMGPLDSGDAQRFRKDLNL